MSKMKVSQLFVPGRLCLFGEHSDWAAEFRSTDASVVPGACLVTGTDQGITASFAPAPYFRMHRSAMAGESDDGVSVAMQPDELQRAAQSPGFFRYAAGTAFTVLQRWPVGGLSLEIRHADLPVQRGLSSSAAACVLVARAFNQAYELGLDIRQEMELAYLGERATGSQCGRMDQACAYGQRPVLLRFSGADIELQVLTAGADFFFLIVDLQAHKDTRRILRELHEAFTQGAQSLRARLRHALGAANAELVQAATAALQCGDAARLGELMRAAQELFDRDVMPASPAELRAPRLHEILAHPALRDLAWGAKGVGSQGDGAAQILCRGESERRHLIEVLESQGAVRCLPLTIRAEAMN